ncbi:MAG TPA: LuxR C-terminal-related transcriptional regulator, partial [Candidatus Limnocylindrales bacterium]|nr:LuxR C-terminal-related transcriptional regulator [Candidatus Limnocylindrales bacterium]
EAIQAAASGRATYSVAAAAADSAAARTPSEQELRLLELVASGASNAEIAGELGIPAKTVESRLHRLFGRYDVLSRTELASFAAQQGWLTGQGTAGRVSNGR